MIKKTWMVSVVRTPSKKPALKVNFKQMLNSIPVNISSPESTVENGCTGATLK